MLDVRKMIAFLLILLIVLLGMQPRTHAEQLNNSVKECIENSENCGEEGIGKGEDVTAQEDGSRVGLTFWDFFKMILATIFTVGLLYVLLKFINKKSKVYTRSQIVENIGGTALGGNRSVQLIKVGKRILVVGVGEDIQLLKEIDDSEEYSQLITEHNDKMEQLIRPSDIVTKVMKRTKQPDGDLSGSPKFSAMLGQQLDEIKKGRRELFDELERKGKKNNE
ncbi:flagellar biosynthetic protein FliO [Cytobacillus sp. NCCP-133]|uniref:flagellar biosynthetic protein FliO n=1 Tax=Cytobacillus sp. NCCP-133 TaxID=766848 RepID=UPI00223123A5|nr:flagellar biosynthetic protein FliO [Cytobacillus sp. NCCP-133]GLB59337.1 flagellar biosynthetic protein FliZ [Cytobacillus sp. NCCP-133]